MSEQSLQLVKAQPSQALSMPEIEKYATLFHQSGMFSDVRAMAQAAVKIIAGQEFGFSPFESMTDLHVIQGKITLGANAMAKAIKRSGRYDYKVIEHDEKICSIDFFQAGEKAGNSSFTIDDARKAGVKNLDKFPRNMLFARCISNGLRWFCPDAVNATIFTPEEIETVEFEPPPKPPPPPAPSSFTPVAEIIGEIVPTEPVTVTPREEAIAEIKRLAFTTRFAANLSQWHEFEQGLLGGTVKDTPDAACLTAHEAMVSAAMHPAIVSWAGESWACSSEKKAYSLGVIIAHTQVYGFEKTKALTGDPTKFHRLDQIEKMNTNLVSWLDRPQQVATQEAVAA